MHEGSRNLCNQCDKAILDSSNLKKHVSDKKGDVISTCGQCNNSGTGLGTLKKRKIKKNELEKKISSPELLNDFLSNVMSVSLLLLRPYILKLTRMPRTCTLCTLVLTVNTLPPTEEA